MKSLYVNHVAFMQDADHRKHGTWKMRRPIDVQVIADSEASGKVLDRLLSLPLLVLEQVCFNISASAIAVLLPHNWPTSALGGSGFPSPLDKRNSLYFFFCICGPAVSSLAIPTSHCSRVRGLYRFISLIQMFEEGTTNLRLSWAFWKVKMMMIQLTDGYQCGLVVRITV